MTPPYDRRAPQRSAIDSVLAAGLNAPGKGTSYQRPPSSGCAGSSYYDTTLSKLVDSTGTLWQDRSGIQVGNELALNEALATIDATPWAVAAGSVARSRAVVPPGRTTSLQITTTGAGTYMDDNFLHPATATNTYSAFCRRFWAVGAARSFYVAINWYAAGSVYLSTSNGTVVSSGSGVWTASNVISAVAPATTGLAGIRIATGAAGTGEVFYVSELCVAPGTITDYIEP